MPSDPSPFRLRAEQVRNMATNGIAGAASGLFGGLAMAGAMVWIEHADPWPVAVWIGLIAAAYAAHVWLCLQWRRSAFASVRPFVAVAFAEGIVWGLGIVWFCATGPLEQELIVILLAGGIAGAVGLSFGSSMPAYLARFLPATLPYVLWAVLASHGHAALHDLLATCVFAFALANVQLARGFNAGFMAVHRARFANLDMAEDLRTQKEAAEAATLAKSRFLAAASHDLRQPIHALGLFVGALQGSGLPASAGVLVQHIGQSVGALDSLFASLMDISRLDAGAIRVNKTAFPLQSLLERIVRDYTGEAHEKGIELTLHPTRSVVMTDAVLLERILRNLISNAVRYTQEGRVVVLCRPAGRCVSLQVWDTGCGIPADEQTRVFDEFYQLQRRDGVAGLGLGLSIVQRLSTLLELGLKLRSQPGRGSCFSLMLPVADEVTPVRSPAGRLIERGRILIVDDNPAITQSMAALLSSWGYEVATALDADGAAACSTPPDLIVCDYHLGTTTGIAVVAGLRARFARSIAAMLITADTSSDVAYAAETNELVLLHKPVANARLRATIRRALMHEHGLAVSA